MDTLQYCVIYFTLITFYSSLVTPSSALVVK